MKTCTIEGCDKPTRSSRALYCALHYKRWLAHGDPLKLAYWRGARPHLSGERSPTWRGQQIGNSGAHARVKRARGRASDWACDHCGGAAADWAYDHLDPREQQDADQGPYSADPDHYIPLCRLCHKKFDLNHIKETA